jgi:opacity protein-like surface antigen
MDPVRTISLAGAVMTITAGTAAAGDWSQLYAGAHLGYGRGQDHATVIDSNRAYFPGTDGPLGGAQIGWMHQWERFVGGLQLDLGHLGQSSHHTNSDFAGKVELKSSIGAFGALTGQVGIVVDQHWLIVARGGLAFAQIDVATVQSCPDPASCLFTPSTASNESVALGVTAAAGAEYAFTPRWAARLEYQYFNFDKQLALPDGPGEGWNHDLDLHTVRFSVNYRF